jgi:osmoprotectant transport system ATP-binding protein
MVGMSYETFAHRYPRQLSGGQQQRVGVLRSLATDPPVILMDEPFGALDPISREVLQTELKRLQAKLQKTIVFVTHDIDEALRLGDRIAILRDGEVLQLGTPDDLLRSPKDEFVAKFIGRLFAPQRIPMDTVRQLMQTGTMHIRQELGDSGRIVQIEDESLLCWVDNEGVFKGSTNELPSDVTQWKSAAWTSGETGCVQETDASDAVLKRLVDGEIEAVPVVDEGHRLVGIVSHRSAIKSLSSAVGRGGA